MASNERPCKHCGGTGVVKEVRIKEDFATMAASIGGISMMPVPPIESREVVEVPCPRCQVHPR